MRIAIINSHFSKHLGGSEVQCHGIARGLTNLGHQVNYLAIDGIKHGFSDVYPTVDIPKRGYSRLIKACVDLKPDVVYWRYNTRGLLKAAMALRLRRIPVVFAASHINDFLVFNHKPKAYQNVASKVLHWVLKTFIKAGNWLGLWLTKGIVVNNRDHLSSAPKRRKIYIPNSPFVLYRDFSWKRPYCVWVSNLKKSKNPEIYRKLAADLSHLDVDFLMIGEVQQAEYSYFNELSHGNFHYLGARDAEFTNGVIKGSLLLVHTCEPEGFPNVFIQAWSFGIPVVSLQYDPSGFINENGIGFNANGDYGEFKAKVEDLIRDADIRNRASERAVDFVQKEFQFDNNLNTLVSFLETVVKK